jgi:alkaline phosphatase D
LIGKAIIGFDMRPYFAFKILLPLLLVFSSIEGRAGAGEPLATVELGPLLGYVGPAEALIWIKASGPASAGVIVGESADLQEGRAVAGPDLKAESDYMGVTRVTELRPAKRYFYKATLDGKPAPGSPHSFVTAPSAGSRGHLRFAFISCIGGFEDQLHQRWVKDSVMAAWRALADVPVDFVLHLGDNVYAESKDVAVLRRMYYWHRGLRPYRRVMAVTPMLAIWDDWDYAGGTAFGDGDGTAVGKQQVLRTFKELWANPSYGQPTDPGIYFKFSWGDVEFFMLDVRYHRSPNVSEDDGQKTMLGPTQLAWLKRELAGSKATLRFLVSGNQWTSSGTSDSWRSFTRERNGLFDFIRDSGIEGVVLLSGDRHLTAGYQVQQRFIEITSSPFATRNHGAPSRPQEMFMLHDQGHFFVVLDADTRTKPPRLVVEVHRVSKGMVRRRPLKWKEINGKVRIPTCEFSFDCRN